MIPSKILTHLGQKLTRARQLGSYRLVEQIGRGGMGEVWRAEHRLFARPAAIKLITAQRLEEASQRGGGAVPARGTGRRRPAVTPHDPALRLRAHPRPEAVLRHGAAGRLRPRIAGQTLRGTAGRERVAYILRQACHSLAEAHAAGLVHRDIKPANLHIGRLGLDYDFVKVLDFGLVKRQQERSRADMQLTAPEAISGTPAYMAPEMASGEPVDSRADLYALGCVGYYLVTGQRIFEGTHPMQVVLQHLRSGPAAVARGDPPGRRSSAADALLGEEPGRPPGPAAPGWPRAPARQGRTNGPRATRGAGGRHVHSRAERGTSPLAHSVPMPLGER